MSAIAKPVGQSEGQDSPDVVVLHNDMLKNFQAEDAIKRFLAEQVAKPRPSGFQLRPSRCRQFNRFKNFVQGFPSFGRRFISRAHMRILR